MKEIKIPDLSGICTTVISLGLKIAGVLESLKILKGKNTHWLK